MTKPSTTMHLAARIIDLLKTSGGFEIDAEIAVALPSAAEPDSTSGFPKVTVELSGADTNLLMRNDAELLHAIRHICAAAIKLHGLDDQQLLFRVGSVLSPRSGSPSIIRSDSAGLHKSTGDSRFLSTSLITKLEDLAAAAVIRVRETERPYTFDPMTSSERRLLHKALAASGLKSASAGDGFKRCVVLYPAEVNPPVQLSRTRQQTARQCCDKLSH